MDIRKTDSKGRLSLGTPSKAYEIIRGENGTIVLCPVKSQAMQVELAPETLSFLADAMDTQLKFGPRGN